MDGLFTALLALITALAGATSAWFVLRAQYRHASVAAQAGIYEAYAKLVGNLQDEINRLGDKVMQMETEIDRLHQTVEALHAENEELRLSNERLSFCLTNIVDSQQRRTQGRAGNESGGVTVGGADS